MELVLHEVQEAGTEAEARLKVSILWFLPIVRCAVVRQRKLCDGLSHHVTTSITVALPLYHMTIALTFWHACRWRARAVQRLLCI